MHVTQYNATQNNKTQHNETQNNYTQHDENRPNDTQHNETQYITYQYTFKDILELLPSDCSKEE